jgi:hypothetical protein
MKVVLRFFPHDVFGCEVLHNNGVNNALFSKRLKGAVDGCPVAMVAEFRTDLFLGQSYMAFKQYTQDFGPAGGNAQILLRQYLC